MTQKIEAQYIGKQTVMLNQGAVYYLYLSKDEPNTVEIWPKNTRITYNSVYAFFKDWKLN